MVHFGRNYELLPVDSDAEEKPIGLGDTRLPNFTFKRHEFVVFLLSVGVNVLALAWIGITYVRGDTFVQWKGTRGQFSPLEDFISYHRQVSPSLLARSPYHGPPTNETDQAWIDLYKDAVSVVSTADASQFSNKTFQYPAPEDRALMTVDVFHVLHCLNTVRMYAWPERYPSVVEERYAIAHGVPFDHIDHCLNSIRESIMCSADITPDVWQKPPGANVSSIAFNNVHTCRNFSAIQEWARQKYPANVPTVGPDRLVGVLLDHPLMNYDGP